MESMTMEEREAYVERLQVQFSAMQNEIQIAKERMHEVEAFEDIWKCCSCLQG